MNEYIIYLDVIFLINFLMDYSILWATAKFSFFKSSTKKLILASAVGSLYSISVFLFKLNLLNFFTKILFSLIMLAIAFYPVTYKKLLKLAAYFYLIGFAVGGAIFGGIYFLKNNLKSVSLGLHDVRYLSVLFGIGVTIFLGVFGAKALKRKVIGEEIFTPITIRIGSKSVTLMALLDTGNSLKDPLSGLPVMVAEYEALKGFFPKEIEDLLIDPNTALLKLAETPLAKRIRVIPFRSVGKDNGILIGILADDITLIHKDNLVKTDKVVVAISHKKLSGTGNYKALLNPEIIYQVSGN